MYMEPLTRFTDDQLEAALDEALARDDLKVVWHIVEEIERRGHVLEV